MNSALCRSFCAIAAASLLACCTSSAPKPGTPAVVRSSARCQLAVGNEATLKEPIEVPFAGTMDINFKTRDEIVNVRRNMASRGNLGQLIVDGAYQPSEVFGDIADEKPWISLKSSGLSQFGGGIDLTDGPAKESRFICSPYLLVAPDIRPDKWAELDFNRFSIQKLASSQFPLQCPPRKIMFDAVNATEEVTYDVSGYRNELNAYLKNPIPLEKLWFNLIAYNARDFGYYYFFVKKDPLSVNIKKTPRMVRTATEIKQTLALVDKNNDMKGDSEELQNWGFTGVPAKMVIALWKSKPADVTDKPDFTVILNFN